MGNLDGFEEFVRHHSAELLRYGRALTRDPEEAWDLVQEALTRVAERWASQQFDDPAAYVRTTMIRLNIDRLRRLRRDALLLARGNRHHDHDLPQDSGGAADWLPAALTYLSPNQRTALALRYIDDLDIETIARRMGCRPGTARSHLSRGLNRLRAAAISRDVTGAMEEK